MSRDEVILLAEYTEVLRDYLATGSEEALSRAYEFGRSAVGGGILELTVLHHQAISAIVLNGNEEARARMANAAEFFTEVVSPLEMALRSYRDSTQTLLNLNERLENQNIDLARAKEAADAANSELEAFSYSVAHDLRAPLWAIDGFSQALVENCEDNLDNESRSYLNRLRNAAQEMEELIEALLALSRVSRGELLRESVDLSALAAATVDRLRRAEPERTVTVEITQDLHAEGDKKLIAAVLDNLIGNAWKFTSKRDDATIWVGKNSKSETAFFVRDNGAGFDPAYADKLFGAFQRLHDANEFKGTGIGLATVRRIVHRHGGRIWAEGAVGRGAVFWFTFGNDPQCPT